MWTELNNRFSSHFLPPADSHLIFAIIARLSTLIIYYTLCCIVGNSQGNFEINQRSAKHRQERGKSVTRTYEFLPSLLSPLCVSHKWWLASEHSFLTYLTCLQKTVVCFFAEQRIPCFYNPGLRYYGAQFQAWVGIIQLSAQMFKTCKHSSIACPTYPLAWPGPDL